MIVVIVILFVADIVVHQFPLLHVSPPPTPLPIFLTTNVVLVADIELISCGYMVAISSV